MFTIVAQAPVPIINDFFLNDTPSFTINAHNEEYKIAPINPSSSHISKTLLWDEGE